MTKEQVLHIATEVGLDTKRLETDMANPEWQTVIDRNLLAKELGITVARLHRRYGAATGRPGSERAQRLRGAGAKHEVIRLRGMSHKIRHIGPEGMPTRWPKRREESMDFWMKSHLGVIGALLVAACGTVETSQMEKKPSAQDPTAIQIDQPLHFSAPDGSDVVVQAGTYQVQQAPNSQLQLVSATAAPPILLSAQTMRSTPDVSKPVALGTLYESDVYHLILLLPGKDALRNHGSVSGVVSRGVGPHSGIVVMKAEKFVLQPTQPQPLPDLVPTCGRVSVSVH